jgi:hypothetical protein
MMLIQTKCFKVFIVAAPLWLQYVVRVILFPLMNVLYFNIRTFRSMCSVPIVGVFCNSLVSCSTGMWSGYFLIKVEMVPDTFVIIGMGFVCIFRISCISILGLFKIFPASLLIAFLSHETTISVNMLPFQYQGWGFPGYRVIWLCQFLLLDSIYDLYILT